MKVKQTYSTDCELSIIGGLLLDNQSFENISFLKKGDFYHIAHQTIFDAIREMLQNNIAADVITVSDWLEKKNLLSQAGGFEFLVNAARNTPSAANIEHYATTVSEFSKIRKLQSIGTSFTDLSFMQGKGVAEALNDAEAMIASLKENGGIKGGCKPIKSILGRAIDKIDAMVASGSQLLGASTGFIDLDKKTSGLVPADLIIIAGRPSMGKSAFGMNIVQSIAAEKPVAVFSLEMPDTDLTNRLVASVGSINLQRLRTGQLNDDEWARLHLAIHFLSELKIFIDDTRGITVEHIRTHVRNILREQGELGAIFIDYLQLMSLVSKKENRTNEVAEISRQLKAIAKEFNVPVIALSQLSRESDKRQDKRPQLADLRESGSIEQDSDLVMFIYRDEVYNEESPDKGTAEIIIAKQRNGPIGMVRLAFRGEFTRFENFSSGENSYE